MKKSISLIVLVFSSIISLACTTFFINKNGQKIFGGNYDWVSGTGLISTNQRGLMKTSAKINSANTITWVSKYGSISFNQYGNEFPTAGMNEKGLVVELMWLDGTAYPQPDERAAVGVLQWIQYQLDNSSTIDEVIQSDKLVRISEKGTPLHYLVADSRGNAASIEFLNGKMTVHRGADLPVAVLTNGTYASSIATVQEEKNNSEKTFQDNSLDRFVKACRMVQKINTDKTIQEVVPYSFDILEKVSQGNFTKWSIVFDITNLKIHFKTSTERNVRTVSFNAFNFDCKTVSVSYNLDETGAGDISRKFKTPSPELKQSLLTRAAEESSQYVNITKKEIDELLNYSKTVTCK